VPKSDSDLDKFSRLVEALRPWLAKVVFVGGWAHRLYRERPEAITLAYQALRTKDADIALDPMLFTRSDEISTRLLDRGFTQRMPGDERPPVTHYHLGHEALGFYAEFLAPLTAPDRRTVGWSTSMRAARQAGMAAAIKAASTVTSTAPASDSGSRELMP
jgi:hypothetical protein